MKRSALVVESTSGDRAVVSFLREEACGSCSGRHFCMNAKKTKAEVKNDIGADVGDTVEIETETTSLLLYSFLLFLAPVLLAVVMYLVFIDVNKALAYSMTAVGFILPYPFAAVLNRRAALPRIISVLKSLNDSGENNTAENNK